MRSLLGAALVVCVLLSASIVAESSQASANSETRYTVTNSFGGRWHGHISEYHEDVIAWKGIQYVVKAF